MTKISTKTILIKIETISPNSFNQTPTKQNNQNHHNQTWTPTQQKPCEALYHV
jgi:hypothetical protein